MMSRAEHLQWCKTRAKEEFNFYLKEGIESAVRNGITSMMSDMNKHPQTKSPEVGTLCVMAMMTTRSREKFMEFIDGFN